MPTIIRRQGWSARIRYSHKPGNFVAFSGEQEGALGHAWFRTRREARIYCTEWRGHSKTARAFPVKATLTLRVEE